MQEYICILHLSISAAEDSVASEVQYTAIQPHANCPASKQVEIDIPHVCDLRSLVHAGTQLTWTRYCDDWNSRLIIVQSRKCLARYPGAAVRAGQGQGQFQG